MTKSPLVVRRYPTAPRQICEEGTKGQLHGFFEKRAGFALDATKSVLNA
jgi:hypothetical protein